MDGKIVQIVKENEKELRRERKTRPLYSRLNRLPLDEFKARYKKQERKETVFAVESRNSP